MMNAVESQSIDCTSCLQCETVCHQNTPSLNTLKWLSTSDKGGGVQFCPRLFVCLSLSKITQKRMYGFGWNIVCRQMSGHGRTDNFWARSGLLSPISYKRCFPSMQHIADNRRGVSRRNKNVGCGTWNWHTKCAVSSECEGLRTSNLVDGRSLDLRKSPY